MKCLFLIALLSLASAFGRGESSFVPGAITGNNVNVRVGPSLKSEIVGQLQKGQGVNVVLTDGEWCAITPPPDLPGWVAAEFIEDGVVIGSRLNVRSGPSVAYARLAQLPKGTRLMIRGREEKWLKIALPPEVRLWVSARYISLEGEKSTPDLPLDMVSGDLDKREIPEVKPVPSEAVSSAGIVSPPPPPPEDMIVVQEEVAVSQKEEPTPSEEEEFFPAPSPAAEARVSGTPFLPRVAPGYLPSRVAEIKSYTGFLRKLAQPYTKEDKKFTHELIKTGYRSIIIGRLTSKTIDLERYQFRKARIWCEKVGEVGHIPLLEVKGIQIMW